MAEWVDLLDQTITPVMDDVEAGAAITRGIEMYGGFSEPTVAGDGAAMVGRDDPAYGLIVMVTRTTLNPCQCSKCLDIYVLNVDFLH